MLYILVFNVLWAGFCLLEKNQVTKLLFSKRSAFEIFEIWIGVALVASFFIYAIMPKKDKRIEKYKCPHCGQEFKGGLKPTFCHNCKSAIEQPKIDSKNRYYKSEIKSQK